MSNPGQIDKPDVTDEDFLTALINSVLPPGSPPLSLDDPSLVTSDPELGLTAISPEPITINNDPDEPLPDLATIDITSLNEAVLYTPNGQFLFIGKQTGPNVVIFTSFPAEGASQAVTFGFTAPFALAGGPVANVNFKFVLGTFNDSMILPTLKQGLIRMTQMGGGEDFFAINDVSTRSSSSIPFDGLRRASATEKAIEIVYGGKGDDCLYGGGSNDILLGDRDRDIVAGGDNDDELFGGKQDDTVDGGAGNDRISGDRGNDSVLGGAGNDTISLSIGNDIITGGPGADVFEIAVSSVGQVNNVSELGVDTLTDFSTVEDIIKLDDQIFTALGSPGKLSSSEFTTIGNFDPNNPGSASGANLVYDNTTGSIYYIDQNIQATKIIELTNKPQGLSADDFEII